MDTVWKNVTLIKCDIVIVQWNPKVWDHAMSNVLV